MQRVIFFFGADGSGKTTLVNLLSNSFISHRFRVVWFRGSHTFASILARILSKFRLFSGNDNPYYNISIPGNIRGLWRFIEFASFLPILLFRLVIPSMLGVRLICERSIPDFVAWVILTLNDPSFLNSIMGKFLLALSINVPYRFYITASYRVLLARRPDMDEYLIRKQLVIYDKLYRLIGAIKIDTSDKNVEESVRETLSHLDGEFLGYNG